MIKILLICLCLTVAFTTQYSNSKGLKYLHYAKTTYCEEKNILDWNCEACHYNPKIVHRFVITNPKFESLSFVGLNREDKEIIVAFRGSDNFRNWLTNLNFVKKSYSGCPSCQVHSGFYNAWNGQKELITNRVKTLLEANPGFKVSVVGHSLGGAIATICAVQLQEQGVTVSNLITFGAPRVGNQEFVNYIQKTINNATRIVRRKDPVPHVPPRSLGFRNFGTEHFYDHKVDVLDYETCHLFDANSCSNTYLVIQTALSVSDHLNYLGRSTNCEDKFSMGLQQQEEDGDDIKLKSQDDLYEEFTDMVDSEYDLGENYHKIDLDDEEATFDWRVQLDDDDMDYLIIVD